MDPAISDPDDPGRRSADIDMFAVQNGYPGDVAASTPSFRGADYDGGFVSRFLNAQASRNASALRDAQKIYAQIEEGNAQVYLDDMPFEEPGAFDAAQLWQADLNILKCSQNPHIVLKRDGSSDMSPGPVCSIRVPSASFARDNSFASDIHASVRTWLGAHALRTRGHYEQTPNDIVGLDYASSNTSLVLQARGIARPVLVVANSGSAFIRMDEIVFDSLKSGDKTYVIEEGAAYRGDECKPCEQALGVPAGYFGDTQKRTYDFMAAWLRARF
jgi:hypothetical protein